MSATNRTRVGGPTSWAWDNLDCATDTTPSGGPTSWTWTTRTTTIEDVPTGTETTWTWTSADCSIGVTTTAAPTTTSTPTTTETPMTTSAPTTTPTPTTTSTPTTTEIITTTEPATTTKPIHEEIRYMTDSGFDTSQSSSANYYRITGTGIDDMVLWAIRVFKGDGTEITATYRAVVYRSTNGSGLQSATWSISDYGLSLTDSIVVKVYASMGSGSYQLMGSWSTGVLSASKLLASTWTVYYWTQRTYSGGNTYGDYWFGSVTYNSRITGFKWQE
jgi:hypothetical protein